MPSSAGGDHPPLPDLTVRQLEYLEAVTLQPTWAAAAESLSVSPSALSQGIAELERRLGLRLFRPEGRRRVPTAAATTVIDHARRVLAQTRDLAVWAAEARSGRQGRLRVGMIDSAAVDHFPAALRRFREERPDVELRLAVEPSGPLLDDLRRDRLDLVVCVAPTGAAPDLHITPLLAEPLGLYPPDGARHRDPARWGPWVTFPAGSHTREIIDAALRSTGAPRDVVAESHQPEVLREMVRLGLGWTVLPVAQAQREPHPLRPLRRPPLTTRRLVLTRRIDAITDPTALALTELLVETAR